jgi:hypothetical protein
MRGVALACVAVAYSACFYDSSWGSVKRAQTHNAVHATPASLQATDADERRASHAREAHVRVYVTDRYAAQELEWDRKVRDLVDGANEILMPTLGVRLEVEHQAAWSDAGDDADLAAVLASLTTKDDGASTDWVVGLVGSIPRLSDSFHEIGMADVIGKHVVLRAPSSERGAIDSAFDKLGAAEREKLDHARKRHRAVAVFLHELGHTLGAIHENDVQSLMNAQYDPNMAGYSDDSVGLMRLTLEHRDKEQTPDEKHSYAAAMLALLDVRRDTLWVKSERDAMISRFRPDTAPLVQPQVAVIDEVPELLGDDRATYRRAVTLSRDGDAAAAWKGALPLFKAYKAVYAVQDLRCTLAMKLVGWPGSQPECDTLMKLSRHR